MNGVGGTIARFREIETFEDVQDFDQRDSSGRWRRGADDVVAAMGAADGLRFFDLVGGEVFGGDQASILMDGRGKFAGHGAVVKIVGVLGDAFQCVREFGLLENFAGLIEVSVAQKNAFGFGKLGEVLISFQVLSVFVGESEAVARKPDRGSDYFFQRKLAVLFLGVYQAGYRTGNADGFVSDDAGLIAGFGEDIALGVEIHGLGSGGGRFFAEVDKVCFAIGFTEEKETAASKIAGLGMDDG